MHAYNEKGEPCHVVKTGPKAKYPTRPTRMSDVKNNGWYGSVTTITGDVYGEDFEFWNYMEAATICHGEKPRFKETVEAYAKRIALATQRAEKEAALIGDNIHDIMEKAAAGKEFPATVALYNGVHHPTTDVIGPALELLNQHGITVLDTEFVTVNPEYGYAGTVDGKVRFATDLLGIGDYKSKKTEAGKVIKPEELHPVQIAAYAVSEGIYPWDFVRDTVLGYNLYISTTEVGRCEIKFWTAEELTKAWGAFKNMLALWEWRNGYSAAR